MRVLISALVLQLAATSAAYAQPDGAVADEQTLTSFGLATDGQSLLDFFRARTRLDSDREHLLGLTRKLGDHAADVRARAAADLIARGAVAIPALRHAINDLSDPVIAQRARDCLRAIDGSTGVAVSTAAVRLLAARRPAGAAQALLAYLPFADDRFVADTVTAAIADLAYADGRPDQALLHALEDPVPLRRAVAGEALCRRNQPEQWPAIRKLLADPKPSVRLRAALALANQQDSASIPVLIDLLAELNPEQRRQAEELLQNLAGEWAPNITLASDDDIARRIRRDVWMAWWRNTDGPALLAEFRKRTLTPEGQAKLEGLIEKLGDEVFTVREQAITELTAFGHLAVPFLREAAKSTDLERRRRAETCLQLIARNEANALPLAAPRLLALRKPPGATMALLEFLPYADGDSIVGEVQSALTALALRDGQPDAALVNALEDKAPARRAAAGAALARGGGPSVRPAVGKLLQDPDPLVCLQVALALAAARDKDAVPVLIESLGKLSSEEAGPALEALLLLAGDKAPNVAPDTEADSRQKCRDAWAAWWRANAAAVDLAKLESADRLLGYTILVEVDGNGNGRVQELDRAGKQRWVVTGLQYPVDAWVIGGNRVLVAEYNGMKVTERDFKGNVLWEKTGLRGRTTNVQRLPNGNTLIGTDVEVLEVDRSGKELFTKNFAGKSNLIASYQARNGELVVLTGQGTCVRMDRTGKEMKTFPAGRDGAWTSGLELVPDGRILIAQPNMNRVQLFSSDGKVQWESNVPTGLVTASWLPNGHVLVASYNSQTATEVDRNGKTVWQHKSQFHVFRARRR